MSSTLGKVAAVVATAVAAYFTFGASLAVEGAAAGGLAAAEAGGIGGAIGSVGAGAGAGLGAGAGVAAGAGTAAAGAAGATAGGLFGSGAFNGLGTSALTTGAGLLASSMMNKPPQEGGAPTAANPTAMPQFGDQGTKNLSITDQIARRGRAASILTQGSGAGDKLGA